MRKVKSWKQVLAVQAASMISPVLAVLVSLLVGALIILAIGEDPVNAYYQMFRGAFGDVETFVSVLQRQVPLLLTGLGYAVAFQSGLIQLGGEGQLYIGAFAAALAGYLIPVPAWLHIPLALLIGALAGSLYSGIAGVLRTKYDVSEFLTTLMMTYIASFLTSWLVMYPFRERTATNPGLAAQTMRILDTAKLPRIWPGVDLHIGYLIGIAAAVLVWFFLFRTRTGYTFRMTGFNPYFAEYGGINRTRTIMIAMLLSGALSGLAGSIEVLGVHRRFVDQFSPGYGWDGLAAAILGGSQPLGTFVASFLFSALKTGALGMDRNTMVPFELRNVVQATIMFFVAANIFGSIGFRRSKRSAKAETKGVTKDDSSAVASV
ncbi:MAG: ABC transporter permease [Firmicutes bacterium]|nr:ABC transporter permease [Bacillota bacterium]